MVHLVNDDSIIHAHPTSREKPRKTFTLRCRQRNPRSNILTPRDLEEYFFPRQRLAPSRLPQTHHARAKVKRLCNMQDPENKSGSASTPACDEQ
jgi:hypothetical protein